MRKRKRRPAIKPKTRPTQTVATELPRVRCLDLGSRSGAFVTQQAPLGHNGQPPKVPTGFGEPRYTPQMQAENPTLPLTRVIKDVLPVGKWKIGHDDKDQPIMWDVTRDQLNLMRDTFSLAQSRGIAMNLTKSHGDAETLIVPTDDLISPLDQVVVENDVLWVSSYVTPEVAKSLQNAAMKVSPGVTTRFEDGHANKYPLMLYHVAVTDQPTVTNQGRFLALSNSSPKGGTKMDEATLELFRQLFAYEGTPLPDTVTTKNAAEILPILVAQLVGAEGEEEEDPAEGDGDTGAETPADAEGNAGDDLATATMSNKILAAVEKMGKTLGARIDAIENGGRKATFEARSAALAESGVITSAKAIQLNNTAARHGYDLSLLSLFEGSKPTVPMGRQSVRMSNATAPHVNGGEKKQRSIEDRVAALLGKKQKKTVAAK